MAVSNLLFPVLAEALISLTGKNLPQGPNGFSVVLVGILAKDRIFPALLR